MTGRHLKIFEKVAVTCRDVERLLCDYVDDELPEGLKLRVDEHICGCEKCQYSLDTYKQVVLVAREIRDEAPPVPQDVSARLRARLNQEFGLSL